MKRREVVEKGKKRKGGVGGQKTVKKERFPGKKGGEKGDFVS